MLKVSLHTGSLGGRSLANQLATLDIAYAKQGALADYLVAMTLRGTGQVEPANVMRYPRWSGSVWDLTARAITAVLYRAEQTPPALKPDRRCAYATRICAVIEKASVDDTGLEIATAEIAQSGRQRGLYTAAFDEDILGPRTAAFEYGCKALNPMDLLLRAICHTWFGSDVLGRRPALILPPTIPIDGEDQFHVEALDEPARTGFKRFLQGRAARGAPAEGFARAEDYVLFLMRG